MSFLNVSFLAVFPDCAFLDSLLLPALMTFSDHRPQVSFDSRSNESRVAAA